MHIGRGKDGKYTVESEHSKGTFYTVDPSKPSCTCPGFRFYASRKGSVCKHIAAVKEKEGERHAAAGKDILAYVKERLEVDSAELIARFGEEAVDGLIKRGDFIEKKGKIRLLE